MKLMEILKVVGLLGVFQLLRLGIKQLFFLFINQTNFSDQLASMAAMSLLTILI